MAPAGGDGRRIVQRGWTTSPRRLRLRRHRSARARLPAALPLDRRHRRRSRSRSRSSCAYLFRVRQSATDDGDVRLAAARRARGRRRGRVRAFRLYEAHRFAPAEEFRRIIIAVSRAVGVLMLTSFWSKAELSRLWVAVSWAFASLFVLASRRLWHARISAPRAREAHLPHGHRRHERRGAAAVRIMQRPTFGFRPIGVVATDDRPRDLGVPTCRRRRRAPRDPGGHRCRLRVRRLDGGAPEEMKRRSRRSCGSRASRSGSRRRCRRCSRPVSPCSRSAGTTALSLRPVRLSGTQVVAKFTFDILLSGARSCSSCRRCCSPSSPSRSRPRRRDPCCFVSGGSVCGAGRSRC